MKKKHRFVPNLKNTGGVNPIIKKLNASTDKKRCTFKKDGSSLRTRRKEKDWVKVLYEVILKILTLVFYHLEKNRRK